MLVDLVSVALWAALLSCSVSASAQLRERADILLASQGIVASLGGLICAIALRAGAGLGAYVAAIGAGVALALAHLPVLRGGGRHALLAVSAGAHFFFSSLWLAVPDITGGSGGLLISSRSGLMSSFCWLLGIMGLFALWARWDANTPGASFRWAILREENVRAEAIGVPGMRMQVQAFIWYGATGAVVGAVGTHSSGYLSPHAFGFGWSLATLAIVMFPGTMLNRLVTLPLAFAALRVLPRAILPVSVGASQAIEVSFPVAVFVSLLLMKRSGSRTPGEAPDAPNG